MLAWDEIMDKCPTMKKLIEDKIASEIDPVKQENAELRDAVVELTKQLQILQAQP